MQKERELTEKRMSMRNDRRISFPMYNMTLNKNQYNKLFDGKPFRKKRIRRSRQTKKPGFLSVNGLNRSFKNKRVHQPSITGRLQSTSSGQQDSKISFGPDDGASDNISRASTVLSVLSKADSSSSAMSQLDEQSMKKTLS